MASTPATLRREVKSEAGPKIIGIYGVSGCGKSTLLSRLKEDLSSTSFSFYEGSEVIAGMVSGGLDSFKAMPEAEKVEWRQKAIRHVHQTAIRDGRTAVITGHCTLWDDGEDKWHDVSTDDDFDVFTLIIYLQVPADDLQSRRMGDSERIRPVLSTENLHAWREADERAVQERCFNQDVLFTRLHYEQHAEGSVLGYIKDHSLYTASMNLSRVRKRVSAVLSEGSSKVTAVVMDGDKTLIAEDTGALFWSMASNAWYGAINERCLETDIFGTPLGYTDTAFQQAALLYHETFDLKNFEAVCDVVARSVNMHEEFVTLLKQLSRCPHIALIVLTCGQAPVWERILEKHSLAGSVSVIGNGRGLDSLLITPMIKKDVVTQLRETENLHVVAFGDSPLDLPMLEAANEAIVVTGDESNRSRSMDEKLATAIETRQLDAKQILLPPTATPRLDFDRLPRCNLDDPRFVAALVNRSAFKLHHATDSNAAKILMTATRDPAVAGPRLREAHTQVGRYLALRFIVDIIGAEEYAVPHVQGHQTSGYRLRNEVHTTIVALMRGGEPLAYGVNDVFPAAMFVHATTPEDLKEAHLRDRDTVILVDSVINNGATVTEFINRVRVLNPGISIVVVAGVVQAKAVEKDHQLAKLMEEHGCNLVALRLSENKYTGTKGTDTGNRLFNTTHME